MLVDVTDGSSTLANERTHLAFLSHGVGACGRRPSESADPQVRRAGRWSKQGGRKLRQQYRGDYGFGVPCGGGPKICTGEMHGILHMADASGQGCGTRSSGPLLWAPRAPAAALSDSAIGYRADVSIGFRSCPRHVSTTAFPWGRRQWAQPSRMYNFRD